MKNKSIILGIIVIVAILLIGGLFLIYQSQTAEAKTITVDGTYHSTVQPDQVEIIFRVLTRADNAQEAQKKNSEISNKLIKSLKESGLSDKEIETLDYNSNKRTVWENNSYVEKGYEVTNSIKIKTKEINKIGTFIDLASKSGVENIDSLTFTITESKKEELYQEALAQAGKNAKDRADKLASAVGFKIKGIKSLYLNFPTPIYYGGPVYATAEKDMALQTPIPPKSIDVDATVSIIYEIK